MATTVKIKRKFEQVKEIVINWLLYLIILISQASFMAFKRCNYCSVCAEVDLKEQLSSLRESTPSYRYGKAQTGVVYRTKTVLKLSL